MLYSIALGGLGPKIPVGDATLTTLFSDLMETLTTRTTEPFAVDLVTLVSHILCMRESTDWLQTLLSEGDIENKGVINVLLAVLNPCTEAPSLLCELSSNLLVRETIACKLLEKAVESSYLREQLLCQPQLCLGCSPSNMVSVVVTLLEKEIHAANVDDLAGKVLIDSFDSDSTGTITALLKAMPLKDQKTSERVFSRLGNSWRRVLLQRDSPPYFADVLTAIGRQMLLNPSEILPLTLFGFVIGDGVEAEVSQFNAFVMDSVLKLLDLCLSKFDESCLDSTDRGMFHRLSPLLLLRRIPRRFFLLLRDGTISPEALRLLQRLIRCLAVVIGADELHDQCSFSTEERRLAAEIASQALPFEQTEATGRGNSEIPSCFSAICLPSFRGLLLRTKEMPTAERNVVDHIRAIRAARASMYAICLSLPLLSDSEGGMTLQQTASFVFELMRYSSSTLTNNDVLREYEQLLAGCTEWMALCLQRLSNLINESSQTSMGVALCSVINGMRCIAERATLGAGQLSGLGEELWPSYDASGGYDVSSRICVWNAWILASQRADPARIVKLGVNWVLQWGTDGSIDHNLRHPLCVAAAAKYILTVGTRLKNLQLDEETTGQSVALAHEWAMTIIATDYTAFEAIISNTTRLVGVKLLLLVLSLDSSDGDEATTQKRIQQTLSALQAIAKGSEGGNEIRELAATTLLLLEGA